MPAVALVLANVFQNLRIRRQRLLHMQSERLSKSFGIIDNHIEIHVPEIAPVVSLSRVKRFRIGMPAYVEPALLVESDAIDNQRVAIPTAHGIAQPRRT